MGRVAAYVLTLGKTPIVWEGFPKESSHYVPKETVVIAWESHYQLAQDLLDGKRLDPDALRDRMLHTVACKAAIKAGWHSDPRELETLAREVMERDDLRYCPHGRPIVVTITRTELEKQCKRQ